MSAPAYVIVRTVSNPGSDDAMNAYRDAAKPAVLAHGGEYLARGGTLVNLEGPDDARRTVVLRFPSLDAATGWYNSEAYTEAIKHRQGHAEFEMFVVEGLES
jgi:uncharacterized protein (DUF1330 family)